MEAEQWIMVCRAAEMLCMILGMLSGMLSCFLFLRIRAGYRRQAPQMRQTHVLRSDEGSDVRPGEDRATERLREEKEDV